MAKKEIVELPDKHTGDIQEIRDKQIALASDATGASDITSQCEYLIKNGQTGEFMNVLKNYIDESIRSALGALVNNLDKGSSISKILATDASNDLGSITPANLASVLSGQGYKFIDISSTAESSLSYYEYRPIALLETDAIGVSAIAFCGWSNVRAYSSPYFDSAFSLRSEGSTLYIRNNTDSQKRVFWKYI